MKLIFSVVSMAVVVLFRSAATAAVISDDKHDNLIGKPVKVGRRADANEILSRQAEKEIKEYVSDLRGYTIGTSWLPDSFGADAEQLRAELDSIAEMVAKVLPEEPRLSAQLRYARYLHSKMSGAVEKLANFPSMGGIYGCISEAVNLNIGLTRFRNSEGEPDLLAANYVHQIRYGFETTLENLKISFRRQISANTPSYLRELFNHEVSNARSTIDELLEAGIKAGLQM
ncbi:hypothetical protein OXX69_006734 [Metschnikowia pulcherrima]